jgi:hypothetical protein
MPGGNDRPDGAADNGLLSGTPGRGGGGRARGLVRDVVYPAAGGVETLIGLLEEYKAKGGSFRQARQKVFKASYTSHYRSGLIALIGALEFRSTNTAHAPVLQRWSGSSGTRPRPLTTPSTTPAASRSPSTAWSRRPARAAVQDRQARAAADPAVGV